LARSNVHEYRESNIYDFEKLPLFLSNLLLYLLLYLFTYWLRLRNQVQKHLKHQTLFYHKVHLKIFIV